MSSARWRLAALAAIAALPACNRVEPPPGPSNRIVLTEKRPPQQPLTVHAKAPPTAPPEDLAARMWEGLRAVDWATPFVDRPDRAGRTCGPVPPQPSQWLTSLAAGVQAPVRYCIAGEGGVLSETFYHAVNHRNPQVLMLRADFHAAGLDNENSTEVLRLLRERLTRAYGPASASAPSRHDRLSANYPEPANVWRLADATIFLHRNPNHTHGAGLRRGVLLIAMHRTLMEEEEDAITAMQSLPGWYSRDGFRSDLARAVGRPYSLTAGLPKSEAGRAKLERETRDALTALLRRADEAEEREVRAAALVAASELAERLGVLLMKYIEQGAREFPAEVPEAAGIKAGLAKLGVNYGGIGKYSEALQYDYALLLRAWREYPETEWGQRAFLLAQRLACDIPGFGCDGPNCFLAVIAQGERFLNEYPDSPVRARQIQHLAVAHLTWWSLSLAEPDDFSAHGAKVDRDSGERARLKAIELFEEMIRIAPESPDACAARLVLPRLKLRLGAAERNFFCFHC